MCLRFMFLLTTRLTAWLRLARHEETWKTAEILILRHQLSVLQRQQPRRPRLDWADRALLATLVAMMPKARRHRLRPLVCGGLRVSDGQAVTMCAPPRNSAFYQDFLQLAKQANPEGTIWVITGNLSSHDSKSTRAWLEDHPRIPHAFIPKRACWLNMQEGWWRIFRRQALAGQEFADPDEIAHATPVATAQLNARARPWIWGRPQPKLRSFRRRFIYTL